MGKYVLGNSLIGSRSNLVEDSPSFVQTVTELGAIAFIPGKRYGGD
jgi:hypothetical protein